MEERPKIGVGVMITRTQPDERTQILLGKRCGSHGQGEWAGPGGHLEMGESIEECARREVMEETGLRLGQVRFLRVMNLLSYSPKHYVDIGMHAELEDPSQEPKTLEPNKCEGWHWFDVDRLPGEPIFATVPSFIEALRTGQNFFDKV